MFKNPPKVETDDKPIPAIQSLQLLECSNYITLFGKPSHNPPPFVGGK